MSNTTQALERIRAADKLFITPAEAASVLGCDPHYIRIAARSCPQTLGFPVIVYGRNGTRTKIPKGPFIAFVTGGGTR